MVCCAVTDSVISTPEIHLDATLWWSAGNERESAVPLGATDAVAAQHHAWKSSKLEEP